MQMLMFLMRSRGFALLLLLWFVSPWAGAQSLTNGGFDNINAGCSNNIVSRTNPFADGCVPGWQSSHGTPDINGAPGDYYAFMYGGLYGGSVGSEGIFTSYAFQNNVQYQFTFWARNVGLQSGTPTLIINIADGLTERGYQGTTPQSPPTAGVTRREVGRQNVTGAWVQYTVNFTAPAAASQFWLYPEASVNVNTSPHQIEVNGLAIVSSCISGNVYYQNTSSLPVMTKAQGSILSGQQVTGGTPGPVTIGTGQTVAFRVLQEIALQDGFNANAGVEFSASVVPCKGINWGLTGLNADGRGDRTAAAANIPPGIPCDCLANASFAESAPSEERAASRVAALATADAEVAVQAYPNPAQDHLVVVLPGIPRVSATGTIINDAESGRRTATGIIYDAYGREVQRLNLQSGTTVVSVEVLKPGIYHLHVPINRKVAKITFEVAR
ncbi:MAG: hypothetical protein M3Y54_03820 [Bacteroidota bacterium]|nr:hypothetical protein [Bacteroidota bacterium]